jgi:hypothetical protein
MHGRGDGKNDIVNLLVSISFISHIKAIYCLKFCETFLASVKERV